MAGELKDVPNCTVLQPSFPPAQIAVSTTSPRELAFASFCAGAAQLQLR
jgi:hypothetical protein